MKANALHWWQVYIGWGNGLVPSGTWVNADADLYHHMVSLGVSELISIVE